MAKRIEIQVGHITTNALVSLPETAGKVGGVVVTFHREGLDAFTELKVDRLAFAGFAAIAPRPLSCAASERWVQRTIGIFDR